MKTGWLYETTRTGYIHVLWKQIDSNSWESVWVRTADYPAWEPSADTHLVNDPRTSYKESSFRVVKESELFLELL